jgi:hypothetical protein
VPALEDEPPAGLSLDDAEAGDGVTGGCGEGVPPTGSQPSARARMPLPADERGRLVIKQSQRRPAGAAQDAESSSTKGSASISRPPPPPRLP